MELIGEIRSKIEADEFEFSKHAVDRMLLRNIRLIEIRDVIKMGKVIENYPEDKYGPSCLIFGLTPEKRPLHIQCSYPSRPKVKIITLYEPDPVDWIDFKVRKN